MSLTSFLKIPEIWTLFKKEFPLKRTKLTGEMRAAPVTKNYTLVGTAFDYLLRFFIEKNNSDTVAGKWVARSVLDEAIKNSRRGIGFWHRGSVPENPSDLPSDDAILEKIKGLVHEAEQNHSEYVSGGSLSDPLLRSCIHLAQIDPYYRAGILVEDMGMADDGDVQDLRNLMSLARPEVFQADKTCYLNPTFGYGSELVGGADADLIIDDVLVDIKTTKSLSFTQQHYNQLIGYYVLSRLGKVNGSEDIPISRIGIYFSRHGVLHTVPTSDIENNPNFPKFVTAFEKLASAAFNDTDKN